MYGKGESSPKNIRDGWLHWSWRKQREPCSVHQPICWLDDLGPLVLIFCSSVYTLDTEFQVWSVVSEDIFPQPAGCFSHWLIFSCSMPKLWISGNPICQFLVLFSVLLEFYSETSCLCFSFEALYPCFASDWVKVSGLTLQSVLRVELDFVQGEKDLSSLSMEKPSLSRSLCWRGCLSSMYVLYNFVKSCSCMSLFLDHLLYSIGVYLFFNASLWYRTIVFCQL